MSSWHRGISSIDDFKNLLGFAYISEYTFILNTDIELSEEPNFYIPYLGGNFNGFEHTISNLYINLPSTDYVGLFGCTNHATIENVSLIDADVTGYQHVGGLVGKNFFSSTISNSYSTGIVSGTNAIGGLAGSNYFSSIINSYSMGSVTGTDRVGGLIGYNVDYSTINNNYSTGSVNGAYHVGGLVGSNSFSSTISNSYSTGSAIAYGRIGGLVGHNGDYCTVSNSYSTGSVTGTDSYVGGLVGRNRHSTVSNSFWDIETSGQTVSEGGTGKTTMEMHNVATYTCLEYTGLDEPWDFVDNPFDDMGNADYWDINVNTNNGYPHFEDPFIVDADDEIIPNSALLTYNLKNYPNPFNPSTTIEYSLDKDNSIVSLEVYNIKGQKVKSLVNEVKEKGTHSVVWDGKNDSHKAVSSGVYFYKLEADNKLIKINKCIILK